MAFAFALAKKWKKWICLGNSQCKEEQKVIREKAEKSETTNDDFVNENFPSLDSIVFLQPKDIVPDLPIHPTVTGYFKNQDFKWGHLYVFQQKITVMTSCLIMVKGPIGKSQK